MKGIIRWIFLPVMRAWVAALGQELSSMPRPADAPQAHSPGIAPDRLLVFGGGIAVGWGVLSHDLGLPGALARAVSVRTGRGVDVDVVADPHITVSTALARVDGRRLWRYDAILIILGVSDAGILTAQRSWRADLSRLLRFVESNSSLTSLVFVAGISPIRAVPAFDTPLGSVAALHATALNRITTSICTELPRTTFVQMTATPEAATDRFRTSADYEHWARVLADAMAAPLDAHSAEEVPSPRETVAPDSVAVQHHREADRPEIDATSHEDRIDRIVATAQTLFGTRSAAFVVTDGVRLWLRSGAGLGRPNARGLRNPVCARIMLTPSALVVPDATADEAFRGNPFVRGEPHIRFFAGFTIECASGEPIGALCVFDPEPRPAGDFDLVLLRELALLIQRELWNAQSPTAEAGRSTTAR